MFIDASTPDALNRSGAYRRRNVRDRTSSPANALYNAAGTPFPDTSPTAITRLFGSGVRKSYRSPPSSRAGAKRAATSTPFMRFGSSVGRRAVWTRWANRSSFSIRTSFARMVS